MLKAWPLIWISEEPQASGDSPTVRRSVYTLPFLSQNIALTLRGAGPVEREHTSSRPKSRWLRSRGITAVAVSGQCKSILRNGNGLQRVRGARGHDQTYPAHQRIRAQSTGPRWWHRRGGAFRRIRSAHPGHDHTEGWRNETRLSGQDWFVGPQGRTSRQCSQAATEIIGCSTCGEGKVVRRATTRGESRMAAWEETTQFESSVGTSRVPVRPLMCR